VRLLESHSHPLARAHPTSRPRDHFGRLQPRAHARASQLRHAHAHDRRSHERSSAARPSEHARASPITYITGAQLISMLSTPRD
jgi:hypothetical protein